MRHHRFLLCAVLPALASVPCFAARAAEAQAAASGPALSIASPCARTVDIRVDPALHDRVTVEASAEHQQELDRLLVDSSGTVRIRTRNPGCWQPEAGRPFAPTLTLAVAVPAGFALTIDEAGAADYGIGAAGGPLTLDLSGEVRLLDQRVTTLHADLGGQDSVRIAHVDGDADVQLSGDGQVAIDEAAIPRLQVRLSGSGSVDIPRGRIGNATLMTSGAGDMRIGAAVGDADVTLSGVGSVRFATITGTLRKTIDGIGTVSVGP